MFTELKELFINHKKKIEKDGIDLIIYPECFPGQQIVITDTVKLKQIFINLIYNAFKFTTQGKIEVGCQLDDSERLMFFVSDTGIGIPPEKQSIIFDRFRQVNEINNPHGGSGLGLAIVKGLVELLGGNINVESSPDKGTKFTFSIHYTLTDNILSKENQTEEEKLCVSSHSILIVEDDKYSGLYIEEILADSGLKIYLADTGKKAVDIALNNHVDIILMDIRLPEMEGYEATRIIKEKCPHVKIIAQTAYATHSDRIKAFDAGCDDYLSKPVSKQLLLTKINFFLHELASEN
jgi:CheY-like chemotaxis protein